MKIQHKRSNQLDGGSAKEPTSEFMEYGELAVNFNGTDPAIFLKDSNDNIVRIAGAGASGNDGRYVEVTGDTMTGQLTLPGGGTGSQAATVDEVNTAVTNAAYVEIAGDTMTGQLTLPGGGSGAEAIQVQEVEALINGSDTGAGTYVEIAGDTMTGQLTLPGGGSGAEAIQVQEVETLIGAIDGSDYVSKTDTASQNIQSDLTLNGGLDVGGSQTSSIVAMAAFDVNCGQGNYFTKTISGNSTFTFSNVPSGKSFAFTLEVTHTAGTITWPAAVKWPADTAPTLTIGNTHLFVFVTDDSGSRWRGAAIIDYAN